MLDSSRNCWEAKKRLRNSVMREETMESNATELAQWRPQDCHQQALTTTIGSTYLTGTKQQMAPPPWMVYCCLPPKSPIPPWPLPTRIRCCLHLFVTLTHAFTNGENTSYWLSHDHTSIVQLQGKLERWVYSSPTVKGLCLLARFRKS